MEMNFPREAAVPLQRKGNRRPFPGSCVLLVSGEQRISCIESEMTAFDGPVARLRGTQSVGEDKNPVWAPTY